MRKPKGSEKKTNRLKKKATFARKRRTVKVERGGKERKEMMTRRVLSTRCSSTRRTSRRLLKTKTLTSSVISSRLHLESKVKVEASKAFKTGTSS